MKEQKTYSKKKSAKKDAPVAEEYKTRNWVTMIYPDSAPENWREILTGWHVPACVSPLHDADVNADGTTKKPHYHILVMWEGPITERVAAERLSQIGAANGVVLPAQSVRGSVRYWTHMDNPEKAQYDAAGVECFGGFDYWEAIEMQTDRRRLISEMMDWCMETGCYDFMDLCNYARTEREDWFRELCSRSTMIMYRYLRSFEHKVARMEKAR